MGSDETSLNLRAPRLLHDLRMLRVAVCHPPDRDSDELLLQLRRIGCQVQAFWPPSEPLPQGIDLVFLAVHPNFTVPEWASNRDINRPVLIAVVTYENPTVIEAVLKLGAESVVTAPVKAFGLLATIVVARQINHQQKLLTKQLDRSENKLAGLRLVLEAKHLLMDLKGITEEDAYRLLREQAMIKRVTVEEIARNIIEAHKMVSFASPQTWAQ